jgi:hypothetical protein
MPRANTAMSRPATAPPSDDDSLDATLRWLAAGDDPAVAAWASALLRGDRAGGDLPAVSCRPPPSNEAGRGA